MTQEYKFKNTYQLTMMHIIIGTAFAGFGIFILFHSFLTGQLTVGTLITLTVIIFIVLINIQPVRCRIQYKTYDKDKIVRLDKAEKKISVTTKGQEEIQITGDEVKEVELFYSWNTNPITSDLGYSKIKLNDGRTIILTQLTIDQSIIKSMFRDKVVREKTRFMNMIT